MLMPSESKCFWNIDRIMHLLIGGAIAAAVIMLVRYLSNVLLPFFVACFIAYMLQPVVDFNRRLVRAKGRVVPALLTILDVTVAVGLVIYIFLPSVISELETLGNIIRDISAGNKRMPETYAPLIDFINRYFNFDNIKSVLTGEHFETLIAKGSSFIENSIGLVLEILSWMLTLVYVLFILIDYPEICRGFKLIIPYNYRDRGIAVVRDVEVSMNRYFRGQGLVATFAIVFYCIGFSIVGLPLAIPMGILVGILFMIPYFQYVTVIPVAILCLIYSLGGYAEFWPMLGQCALVYVISQCICDYIVTPHVMGRELGMNPAIILLSLSVWGSLLGIIGMIIALPVTSLITSYYKRYISEPVRRR